MFLVDTNVLIYAFRRDSPFHQRCYGWLTAALANEESVGTTTLNEVALARIVTLPSLGPAAAPAAEVFRFLGVLKAHPAFVTMEPGERHLGLWSGLCSQLQLRGNDVNDAFLAAVALEWNATVVSADRGFSRFPKVALLNPLD